MRCLTNAIGAAFVHQSDYNLNERIRENLIASPRCENCEKNRRRRQLHICAPPPFAFARDATAGVQRSRARLVLPTCRSGSLPQLRTWTHYCVSCSRARGGRDTMRRCGLAALQHSGASVCIMHPWCLLMCTCHPAVALQRTIWWTGGCWRTWTGMTTRKRPPPAAFCAARPSICFQTIVSHVRSPSLCCALRAAVAALTSLPRRSAQAQLAFLGAPRRG